MSDVPILAQHGYFDTVPLPARPVRALPGGARLGLAFVVSCEAYEMQPAPAGAALPLSLPGGFGRGPYPDFRTYSNREYGNRIGVFRVMEVLDRHGLKATAAVDATVAHDRRTLVEEAVKRGWEIAAHGTAVTQLISSALAEDEERARIRAATEAITAACGVKPRGWHGPEYGESHRTPALLAEAGYRYVLDWPNDEQPYAMTTPQGPLVAVPMAIDLDDVFAHWHRKLTMARWQRAVSEAVDTLLEDGKKNPRTLVLNLHPWLIGQPWRIGYLDSLLQDLRSRGGIAFMTAGDIAAWHLQQPTP